MVYSTYCLLLAWIAVTMLYSSAASESWAAPLEYSWYTDLSRLPRQPNPVLLKSLPLRKPHPSGKPSPGANPFVEGRRTTKTPKPKGCVDIFQIQHGQASCGESGCRLRCLPGYRFIASEQSDIISLACNHATNKLLFRGLEWRPEMTLCAPYCASGCLNGGSCVSPGVCDCPAPFAGKSCQEKKSDQLQKDAPADIKRVLKDNERLVECDAGQQMPDGRTVALLFYEKGHWWYENGTQLLGVDQVTCAKFSPVTTHKPTPSTSSFRPRPIEPTSPPLGARPPFPSRMPMTEPTTARSVIQPEGPGPKKNVLPLRTCTYPRFSSEVRATVSGNLQHLKFTCSPGHITRDGRTWVTITCREGQWWRSVGQPLREEDVHCRLPPI